MSLRMTLDDPDPDPDPDPLVASTGGRALGMEASSGAEPGTF